MTENEIRGLYIQFESSVEQGRSDFRKVIEDVPIETLMVGLDDYKQLMKLASEKKVSDTTLAYMLILHMGISEVIRDRLESMLEKWSK